MDARRRVDEPSAAGRRFCDPARAADDAEAGSDGANRHLARQRRGLERGADLRAGQRLRDQVVQGLRRACRERRAARGDQCAGPRRAIQSKPRAAGHGGDELQPRHRHGETLYGPEEHAGRVAAGSRQLRRRRSGGQGPGRCRPGKRTALQRHDRFREGRGAVRRHRHIALGQHRRLRHQCWRRCRGARGRQAAVQRGGRIEASRLCGRAAELRERAFAGDQGDTHPAQRTGAGRSRPTSSRRRVPSPPARARSSPNLSSKTVRNPCCPEPMSTFTSPFRETRIS